MTKFKEWPHVPIDLLCGETRCQSFSVAGLRKGLDDPRGNLMLTFGAIAAFNWKDTMLAWIKPHDDEAGEKTLTSHPMYFNLQGIRPAAITNKLAKHDADADAYDFAAHANPATPHPHYDRRRIKRASATE